MNKIINITLARKELLKLADNLKSGDNIILSKDSTPITVFSAIADFEKKEIQQTAPEKKISLIIVAARKCDADIALKSIAELNKLFSLKYNPYSKIIFVYSKHTFELSKKIDFPGLYVIENEKFDAPLITSIKCGMNGLTDERFFTLTFLSRVIPRTDLIEIAEKSFSSRKGIIIKMRNNKPSHPISFSISYKKFFLSVRKELGVPYIIKKFKKDVEYTGC